MKKTFEGKVVSLKMQNTAVVEITRRKIHPLYKRLLKRSKKYKVDTAGLTLNLGDRVKIVETRPISKNKYFKIMEVIK
ncbi:MAG: 30S ribosomal protein S17 [Patescibacteria group bacterium]